MSAARIVVKVCGITEERDAHEAIHLGADALGFDFRENSPRAIDVTLARRIVDRLPAFVTTVGVFADLPLIQVLETARKAGVGLLQFHGNESPSICGGSAPFKWIKAFRVDASFDPEAFGAYASTTFLVDARRSDPHDASPPFEWRRVRAWSNYGRVIIAGHILPAHVGMAVEDARPYGVDVLEEVEVAPGKKDLDRLELFLDAVRRAERRIAGETA
jgi:phosphoribosylanthranilate isomerase